MFANADSFSIQHQQDSLRCPEQVVFLFRIKGANIIYKGGLVTLRNSDSIETCNTVLGNLLVTLVTLQLEVQIGTANTETLYPYLK